MKTALVLLALLFASISITANGSAQLSDASAAPASATVQHLEEDEAGWDCRTMGNAACTADELWAPVTTQHEALVQCILNLEQGTEREACINAAFIAFPAAV